MSTTSAELSALSHWVGDVLRLGQQSSLRIHEEPVTEFMLLRLKLRLGPNIRLRAFDKHTEGILGSDWQMIFATPGQSRARYWVQAKRLGLDGRFDLAYRKGQRWGNRQAVKLIRAATRGGAYPMYALYSDRSHETLRVCGPCHAQRGASDFCVALLPADVALDLAKRSKTKEGDVLPRAVPFSCLVGCRTLNQTFDNWVRTTAPLISYPDLVGDVEPDEDLSAVVEAVLAEDDQGAADLLMTASGASRLFVVALQEEG